MDVQKKFLVIYGPTGVGKTDLSLQIGQHIPVEIINMDVGQFYMPLSIGTAKPDWKSSIIPHHLFDVLDSPVHLNVVSYRQRVESMMCNIWDSGKIPLLVGGSGFYLRSLLFPLQADLTESITIDKNISTQDLWKKLYAIDSSRALEISSHDRYRIERALTMWQTLAKKPSQYKPAYKPFADYKIFYVTRDRKELYARINARVDLMLQAGWLDEVKNLIGTPWEQFILEKKLIGYDELIFFIHEGEPKDTKEMYIEKIKQRSRNYAKRQETFWRMLSRQIKEFEPDYTHKLFEINLTSGENQQYSKELLDILKNWS